MKPKHKLALVIFVIAIGLSYESSRNTGDAQTLGSTIYPRLADHSLQERIILYEQGLVSSTTGAYKYVPQRGWIPEVTYQGNLVARAGRNMGNSIQNFVRESLRGLFRFFDGVIS